MDFSLSATLALGAACAMCALANPEEHRMIAADGNIITLEGPPPGHADHVAARRQPPVRACPLETCAWDRITNVEMAFYSGL